MLDAFRDSGRPADRPSHPADSHSRPVRFSCDLSALSPKDECLFRGLVRLLESHLNSEWTTVEAGEPYNVLVADVDSPEWPAARERARLQQADLLVLSSTPYRHAAHFLLKPLRSHGPGGVVDVLNAYAASALSPAPPAVCATLAEAVTLATEPAQLQCAQLPDIYVVPGESAAYSAPLQEIQRALHIVSEPVRLIRQPIERIRQQISDCGLQRLTYPELLWVATTSDSRAQHRVSPTASFKLRRWPDFGSLPHEPAHLGYAAILTRRPASATDLAAAASTGVAHAIAFLSACSVLELLQPVTAPPPPKETRPAESAPRVGVLRGLLRRLGVSIT